MTPLAVETFISSGFDGMPKNAVFPHVLPLKEGQWLGAESNRRHVDFQSTALPTELPSRDRRRTARRREVFTMQQCDCRATPKGFRADPQNAANSLRCATWNSSYNRPHEEDHFHE